MPPKKTVRGPSLPNPLRCGQCGILKDHRLYSRVQLDNGLDFLRRGEGLLGIRCHECLDAGENDNMYLTCVVCGVKKLKEGNFSRAMRRNPDNAQCERCAMGHEYEGEILCRASPPSKNLEPGDLDDYVADYEEAEGDDTVTNPYEELYDLDDIEDGTSRRAQTMSTATTISSHQGLLTLLQADPEEEDDASSVTPTENDTVTSAWNDVVRGSHQTDPVTAGSRLESRASGNPHRAAADQQQSGRSGWARVPQYVAMDASLNPTLRALNRNVNNVATPLHHSTISVPNFGANPGNRTVFRAPEAEDSDDD